MTTKISATQIRIITHMLTTKADAAVKAEEKLFAANAERLNRDSTLAAEKVLNKHRKALATAMMVKCSGYTGDFYCIDFKSDVHDKFRTEMKAALEKISRKGTNHSEYVTFSALDAVVCVPTTRLATWKALAYEIDVAFLSGDASKIAEIIAEFPDL